MKETDRSSLLNPTPLPGVRKPEPPQQPQQPQKPVVETPVRAEEPRVQETPKKKKKGGLVLGLILAAAAAVGVFVMLGGGESGGCSHRWDYVSCDKPMICELCGESQTGSAGHLWSGGSCTKPNVCTNCGAEEEFVAGHQFVDGKCTVCGEAAAFGLRKWEDMGFDADYEFDAQNMALRVTAPGKDGFATDTLLFKDYTGQAVNPERYIVERGSDGYVTLHLPKDLASGRYTICSGYFETEIAAVWLGEELGFLPAEHEQWYSDFEMKSWKHGRWLATSESEALLGVGTEEEATRFESAWHVCTITDNGTDAILSQTASPSKLVIDGYRRFLADGTEETVQVFRYEKWYLAMNSYGEVYLTDAVNEDCYWVITSSL